MSYAFYADKATGIYVDGDGRAIPVRPVVKWNENEFYETALPPAYVVEVVRCDNGDVIVVSADDLVTHWAASY